MNRPCRVATFEIGKKESGTVKHERERKKNGTDKRKSRTFAFTQKREQEVARKNFIFSLKLLPSRFD